MFIIFEKINDVLSLSIENNINLSKTKLIKQNFNNLFGEKIISQNVKKSQAHILLESI